MTILEALSKVTEEVRDWVKDRFVSKSDILPTHQYINNTCAPAISKTVEGKSILVSDVSPLEHTCSCLLTNDTYQSKNIYDFNSDSITVGGFTSSETLDTSPVGYTINHNGTITFNGMVDPAVAVYIRFDFYNLTKDETYTFSLSGDQSNEFFHIYMCAAEDWSSMIDDTTIIYNANSKIAVSFPVTDKDGHHWVDILCLYTDNPYDLRVIENLTVYPQLELGREVHDWQPYDMDFSQVRVYINGTEYIPTSDGKVDNIPSTSPNMEITTTDADTDIHFQYNADTKTYIDAHAQGGEYTIVETDPTVSEWAKADSKPSYTKSEVGLGNVDNVRQYSTSNPPPYPVTSVNGNTGAITINALPNVTTNDNGKVLMVVNGAWQVVDLNMTIDSNGVVYL